MGLGFLWVFYVLCFFFVLEWQDLFYTISTFSVLMIHKDIEYFQFNILSMEIGYLFHTSMSVGWGWMIRNAVGNGC